MVARCGIVAAAAATSARGFRRDGERTWAIYSRGSAWLMGATFVLFAAAFGQARALVDWGGVIQRVSIIAGFWMGTGLSIRAGGIRAASG